MFEQYRNSIVQQARNPSYGRQESGSATADSNAQLDPDIADKIARWIRAGSRPD
jgi:hypothetical protein